MWDRRSPPAPQSSRREPTRPTPPLKARPSAQRRECIGQSASIAALLLAAGTPKKRYALPNSRVLIHQPWMSGLSGQATDIDIHAKEIIRTRTAINKLLAGHTGQPLEKIERDVERDFIMTAEQAKAYGIVDEIITKHRSTVPKG